MKAIPGEREESERRQSGNAKTTIGRYLLDRLFDLGAHHIFGIPGDYILRFNKVIEEHQIQFINTTRENTAGHMASGYARAKGIGAACITYGVGINIANAAAQAYVERCPLVIISGAVADDDFTKSTQRHHLINKTASEHRDKTQLEIFKQVTAAQTVLHNPELAGAEIDRVLNCCMAKKQPVYIELPRNRVDSPIASVPFLLKKSGTSDRETLREALAETARLLHQCKRPLLWLGHELHRYGLSDLLLQFAEKYNIPIASSMLGKTVVRESHPLFVGIYNGASSQEQVRKYVEEECDCLITLGVMLNDTDTGFFTAKLEPHYILLATGDKVTINHHHYSGLLFEEYVKALAALELNLRFRNSFPTMAETIPESAPIKKGAAITTERLFCLVQQMIRPDDIIVADVGDALFGSLDLLLEQECFVATSYFATLGFAIPAAIGVQIAKRERRLIAIVGDGAFQISGTELSTALRYGLPVTVLVLNNHGYGTERPIIEGGYNDIVNWNYSAITELLGGGKGWKAATEEQFEKAFNAALADRKQFNLIEIELDKRDFSPSMQRFVRALSQK